MHEHLAPGRAAQVRPATAADLRQTAVLWIDLAEAFAKVRTGGPNNEPADEGWLVWAGVIPTALVRKRPRRA